MNLKEETLALLKKHGLAAKKSLGQNFLISETALEQIVGAAELTKDDFVLEIGPGLGTLTKELVENAGKVLSLEMDTSLKNVLAPYNVNYIDALKFDPSELPKNFKLVANIPYYITSPILNHFIKDQFIQNSATPQTVVLLMQREVAEKIVNEKRDSVLSLNIKVFGEPEIIAHVKADCFYPAPKVDSSILKINIFEKPKVSIENLNKFFKTIKIGFSSPRKKLSNNLKPFKIDQTMTEIDLNRRAETLSIGEWVELSNHI